MAGVGTLAPTDLGSNLISDTYLPPRPLDKSPLLSPFFPYRIRTCLPCLPSRTVVGIKNETLPEVGTVLTLPHLSSLQQAKELINK